MLIFTSHQDSALVSKFSSASTNEVVKVNSVMVQYGIRLMAQQIFLHEIQVAVLRETRLPLSLIVYLWVDFTAKDNYIVDVGSFEWAKYMLHPGP